MKIYLKSMIASSQLTMMNGVTVERIARPDSQHTLIFLSSSVTWTPIVVALLDLRQAIEVPWPNLDHNLLYMEQLILLYDLDALCGP